VSKVTFRADEDLIRRVEALDASKSEVMREALRAYLDGPQGTRGSGGAAELEGAPGLDVTIRVEPSEGTDAEPEPRERREPAPERGRRRNGGDGRNCNQCGEDLSREHVYCPNCGEKAANRLFCDCGDEIRSDWAYCPSCGRRTPSADVLDG
jgi:hypothetical protein